MSLLTLAALHTSLALQAGPQPQPPTCGVAVRDEALVVLMGKEVVARLPLEPAQLPIQPGVESPSVGVIATADPGRFFVGIREDWNVRGAAGLGELFEVRCTGKPNDNAVIRLALREKGVDFGTSIRVPDGRVVVGGWGGLRVLELEPRPDVTPAARLTPLTTAPSYRAPACWSATEDKPAPGADVPDPSAGLHGSEVPFLRGGACGYEGDMTMAPHVLDLDRGVYRKRVEVSDVVTTGSAVVVAAGGCARLDAGLWVSPDPSPCVARAPGDVTTCEGWTRRVIGAGVPMRRLARLEGAGGTRWFALSAICPTGADRAGGDLYTSADLETWTRVEADLPIARDGAVRGLGGSDLREVDGTLFLGVDEGGGGVKRTVWVSSQDGVSFAKANAPRARPAAPVDEALKRRLGVDSVHGSALDPGRRLAFAWTNDGLFATPIDPAGSLAVGAATWTRILPWRGGSD